MNIWVIMIIVMVLSYIIQLTLNSKFDKYSRIPGPHGLTGRQLRFGTKQISGLPKLRLQFAKVCHFAGSSCTISIMSPTSTLSARQILTSTSMLT